MLSGKTHLDFNPDLKCSQDKSFRRHDFNLKNTKLLSKQIILSNTEQKNKQPVILTEPVDTEFSDDDRKITCLIALIRNVLKF